MDLFAFLNGGETAAGAENRGEGECAGWDAVLVHFSVERDGMGEMRVEGKGPDERGPDELVFAVGNLIEHMAGVAIVVGER